MIITLNLLNTVNTVSNHLDHENQEKHILLKCDLASQDFFYMFSSHVLM
uniref:Uncharacterized protein n=1 Tax=Rhizophora mucronata TaxID=61149 RepID=A0A2P2QXM7_RHIMU